MNLRLWLRCIISTSSPRGVSRTSVTVAAGSGVTAVDSRFMVHSFQYPLEGYQSQSLGAVAHAGFGVLQGGERAVTREPGSLGVVRRRHVFELDADVAGLAPNINIVGVVPERRIGDDFQFRPVEADPSHGQ